MQQDEATARSLADTESQMAEFSLDVKQESLWSGSFGCRKKRVKGADDEVAEKEEAPRSTKCANKLPRYCCTYYGVPKANGKEVQNPFNL